MLRMLDEHLGYIENGELKDPFFSSRYKLDENGHLPLIVYKKWALYEIVKAYEDAYDDLELTVDGFRVDVNNHHVELLTNTIELLEYEGKDNGTLDLLAKGNYVENVPISTLKEIRIKMIKMLDDLLNIRRRYAKMVVEAKDPQTIKDIELKFDIEGMNTNA